MSCPYIAKMVLDDVENDDCGFGNDVPEGVDADDGC